MIEDLSYSKIAQKIALEVKDTEFLDIQIYIFLERLLAIALLYFSLYPKKPMALSHISRSNMNPQSQPESLMQFFSLNQSSAKLYLDLIPVRKFISTTLNITANFIPKIFCELDFDNKPANPLEFSELFLNSLFYQLFSGKTITLADKEKQSNDFSNQILNPATLGDCYEQIVLPVQKSRAQKGIFYSPSGEIRCTITFAVYTYLEKSLLVKSDTGKEALFEILTTPINFGKTTTQKKPNNEKLRDSCLLKLSGISVLDPACGSGSFLIHLLDQIHQIDPNYWFQHSFEMFPKIHGVDINPLAILISDFRIWCWLYDHYESNLKNWALMYKSAVCIHTGDFLVDEDIFAEKNPTYHIIVGNPPYIRNRDIMNPSVNEPLENQKYRELLRLKLREILQIPRLPTSRFDYSIYFCFHALSQLSPGGVLGFIISNSWMNVKYGGFFQERLLKYFQIRYIFDNLHRSFPTAEINTVIAIIQNPEKSSSKSIIANDFPVHFVKYNKPYSTLFESRPFNDINNLVHRLQKRNQIIKLEKHSILLDHQQSGRILTVSSQKLFELSSSDSFIGHSWGTFFFNAPEFVFRLNDEIGKNVLFLNQIASIRRGITTNCNDFFILTKIKKDLYMNGYGDQFHLDVSCLIPFLTSPKHLTSPLIKSSEISTFLFYTAYSKSELKEKNATNILEYIEYGEKKRIQIKKGSQKGKYITGVHKLASFQQKSPERWYCLNNQKGSMKEDSQNNQKEISKIIIQKIFNTTFKVGLSSDVFLPNNTFYEIIPKPHLEIDNILFMALLLNSLAFLSLELRGRINFGGGALDTATFDIGKILMLNPTKFSKKQKHALIEAVQLLLNQQYPNNLPKSLSIAQKTLDQIVLSHLSTSLTPEQVYLEFQRIQRIRTDKKSKV